MLAFGAANADTDDVLNSTVLIAFRLFTLDPAEGQVEEGLQWNS
jgi:hypothetical protein